MQYTVLENYNIDRRIDSGGSILLHGVSCHDDRNGYPAVSVEACGDGTAGPSLHDRGLLPDDFGAWQAQSTDISQEIRADDADYLFLKLQ